MELCISLPIILALLLFIAQIGMAFNEWNVISFAAREGARYGAETKSTSNAQSRAISLIKANKNMSSGEALSNRYTISAATQNNCMNVTIKWNGNVKDSDWIARGINLEASKTFRLGN